MQLTFKEINTVSEKDLKELSRLAFKIWNAYYPPIIGRTQIDYMLNKFYSIESLKDQINTKKNIFIAAYKNNEMLGFISYSQTGEEDHFIHKLYVNTKLHSKGIGRALYNYVFENKSFKTIRLTVNRQNYKAINFYFKLGFVIERIIDIDIEEGFVMNDFVMIFKPDTKKNP